VDVKRNLRIDLDERTPYRFFPADANNAAPGTLVRRNLQLLVGTAAWLDGRTVGIERLPVSVELHPNYPNPFNPSTTIRFGLREATLVRLEIRNVRGQLVKVLANDSFDAGQHALSWDGTDDSGHQVASGIYLTYFQAGSEVRTRKMTLIR
ncbi:FlgD immunoglobulin-like domain containing protein, partial [Gemmatimonadota bacterium]